MTAPEKSHAAAEADAPKRPFVARLASWAAGTRLRMAIASGVGLAIMAAMFAAWSYVAHLAVDGESTATLPQALEALDKGRFEEARQVIADMRQSPATPELLGGAMFVLGAVKTHEAQAEPSADRRSAAFQIAARYLEKARSMGVPEGREGQAAYLLGASLVGSGSAAASVAVLNEALADKQQPPGPIHSLLVRALLSAPDPNLDEALQHNQLVIDDPSLSPEDRDDAWLQRAETLIRLHRSGEALAAIARTTADGPLEARRKLLTGRTELDEATRAGVDDAQRKTKLDAALRHLQEAEQRDGASGALAREALYWMARCQQAAGQPDAAMAHYERLSKLYGDTPEGLAAMLAEADFARTSGQVDRAMEGYRAVLQAVGNPRAYVNTLLSLADLKDRLSAAYAQFVKGEMFSQALAMVDLCEPVLGRIECTQLRAKTHQEWGASRRDKADGEKRSAADTMRKEGRFHLRAAGQAYEDLARMRFATRFFPEDLWTAADCYFQGQSYTNAARMLEEYLHHEAQRWNALALVRLGQSKLALRQLPDAIVALEECIDVYPQDAVVYQARLECARAYQQTGKTAEAEKLLKTNLASNALTPLSPEWRDSKFALGHLLYESGRFDEAIDHLDEAVRRFPQDDQSLLAKYTIARSYHSAAEALSQQLREPKQDNEAQTARMRKQLEDYLNSARASYQVVQKEITLDGGAEQDPLTRALQRNCYMMQGSVLMELKRYEEARQAYQNVITLYQDDPVVLEGFVQVANCWRRLDQPVMARGNLKQAKMVLDKLPANANFLASTNFNRQQWSQLLEEMGKW